MRAALIIFTLFFFNVAILRVNAQYSSSDFHLDGFDSDTSEGCRSFDDEWRPIGTGTLDCGSYSGITDFYYEYSGEPANPEVGSGGGSGNPVDICPNVSGNQDSVPPGMVKDAAGNCVDQPPVTHTDPNNPQGWLDSASCDSFNGWASDADDPNAAIDVHFYSDGAFVGAAHADGYRGDVGNHAFSFPTPVSVKDGSAHAIDAYGINIGDGGNAALSGSGKSLNCALVVQPPAVCSDPAAINYGEAVNCAYPLSACQDSNALNYGGLLPCSYPPVNVCQDAAAVNVGGLLPCDYAPGGNGSDNTDGGGANDGGNVSSGFTLDGDASVSAKFSSNLDGTSPVKDLEVNPFGSFDQSVVVRVDSTTCSNVSYSFDGADFEAAPQAVMTFDSAGNYRAPSGRIGLSVQLKFSAGVNASCSVIFIASGGGQTDSHTLWVSSQTLIPNFQEF